MQTKDPLKSKPKQISERAEKETSIQNEINKAKRKIFSLKAKIIIIVLM